jgi:integrase
MTAAVPSADAETLPKQMRKQKQRRPRRDFGRIRQRRSGRWQASYLLDGRELHYAADTFATEGQAVAWLENERHLLELNRITPGTWCPPSERATRAAAARLTFGDYADRWLEHRPLSRRTRDNYAGLLRLHLVPTFGALVLTAVEPDDVRAWFSALGTEHPTRNAHAYGLLSAIFSSAVDDGLIARSPARIRGAAGSKRRRPIVLLEPAELAALAEAMPATLRTAVLVGAWLALRRGELFALRRHDVASDGSTVSISRAVTYRQRRYVEGATKTAGSVRTVSVPPHLRPVLVAHLAEHVDVASDALLWPDPVSGSFYAEGRFRGPWVAARESIGRPALRVHDLRHFGATFAAVAGGTTAEIQARLGHTSSGAAQLYQHVARNRDDHLAARLSELATVAPPASTLTA